MNTTIHQYLESLSLGDSQVLQNLQCFPILSEEQFSQDYYTLDEALDQDAITITELDHDGSVPELKVLNHSDKNILIMDGEELVGAKQNRIVNTSILVPRNKDVLIPVSCVEQGRWSHVSPKFSSKARSMPSYMRAKKARKVNESVKSQGRYSTDQQEIWNDISVLASRMGATSPSMEMGAIFEKQQSKIKHFIDTFSPMPNQIG